MFWLPLLLFAFKDINTTALATIFVTSIWPIIINTALGVKSVSEDYLNVAKVLRFNPLEKVFQIILPVAVPYFYRNETIFRDCLVSYCFAEMLTGGIGIGFGFGMSITVLIIIISLLVFYCWTYWIFY